MGFLTALLTLVTAGLGLLAANMKSERDELRAESNQLADERTDLSDRLQSAQDEIDDLELQLTDATTTTTTRGGGSQGSTVATSPPTTDVSAIRQQTGGTPLSFTWAYSADLGSEDTDWRVTQGTESGWDLYLDGNGSVTTHEVTAFDHVPTEAECRDATVRQPGLRDDRSNEGLMMCVRTTEDRFAFVRIVDIDEEQQTTSVDIVIWE